MSKKKIDRNYSHARSTRHYETDTIHNALKSLLITEQFVYRSNYYTFTLKQIAPKPLSKRHSSITQLSQNWLSSNVREANVLNHYQFQLDWAPRSGNIEQLPEIHIFPLCAYVLAKGRKKKIWQVSPIHCVTHHPTKPSTPKPFPAVRAP